MTQMRTRGPGGLRARGTPWALAMALLLLLASCSSSTEPVLTLWEGTLVPSTPGCLSGSVAAVTQFGRTLVSIQIGQGQEGAVYGWRINSGTCPTQGAIQGGAAIYPPMTADEAGTAEGEAVVPAVFRSGSAFAVRVFRSADGGPEEILACGELREQ